MSTFNELLHGPLQDVHDHLHYREGVTEQDVRLALTNALVHIISLEKRLAILEQKAAKEGS